ncbi:hypothetical protein FTO70_01640 [Methanosarcina sp. KYL-1]|uniref:hypothetical protein n=1 Tax=Methanosarcina sp. KYL-1 TaxID=2602068 RepID=UPI0021008801|nr:hypothetical protein [Methanosarcina sp. KYL-1]MCQ1534418.1 hypothetical protein [Methanosarcina sp. KYL-1]
MDTTPFFNPGPQTNYDKQWAFEVAYFIQHIGAVLRDIGDSLNTRDYVEARFQASEIKQRAEYEKTLQPDFRTSDYFMKSRRLFNSFLDECVNFAELLRVTTIQEETGCEELLDKPEQIKNSVDRLNLLKEMLTDELHLQGWF